MAPSLTQVQSAIDRVAGGIVNISKSVLWWAKDEQKTFYSSIISEASIEKALDRISMLISGIVIFDS